MICILFSEKMGLLIRISARSTGWSSKNRNYKKRLLLHAEAASFSISIQSLFQKRTAGALKKSYPL
jgi:hypothetical protein